MSDNDTSSTSTVNEVSSAAGADAPTAVFASMLRAIPTGSNVSQDDYAKCIDHCTRLGNSEQILVCMEGCRSIDSGVALALQRAAQVFARV